MAWVSAITDNDQARPPLSSKKTRQYPRDPASRRMGQVSLQTGRSHDCWHGLAENPNRGEKRCQQIYNPKPLLNPVRLSLP